MSNPKLTATIVEISTAALYRAAGLTPSTEAEFAEIFGREPDVYDRRLGLERAIEFQRTLAKLF